MRLDFCPTCGKPLVRITTKTAFYKAVCLDCEMTYKLSGELQGLETIKFKFIQKLIFYSIRKA